MAVPYGGLAAADELNSVPGYFALGVEAWEGHFLGAVVARVVADGEVAGVEAGIPSNLVVDFAACAELMPGLAGVLLGVSFGHPWRG